MSGKGLEYYWYRRGLVAYSLWPLAVLFCTVVRLRRLIYGALNRFRRTLPVPVVVVGNISVGGTGKTPMVVWLANQLKNHGLRPGIISRGYGGRTGRQPLAVDGDSDPAEAGDEPVLIARRTGCPVYVAPNRLKAAHALLKERPCDVLIADDGLQHYRLPRDLEVVMVDARRRFGNGFCLPAGPLREPVSRLARADFVVVNGRARPGEIAMGLSGTVAVNLADTTVAQPLAAFRHQTVHAVAGIGHPDRFFDTLRAHGLQVEGHAFPDHHAFQPGDLAFGDDLPVLMTEKDAVKCQAFATPRTWAVPVSAVPDTRFAAEIINRIRTLAQIKGRRSSRG